MAQAYLPERRPALLHPGFIGCGASLLIAVFFTDLLYWQSLLFQWNNFSAWLLLAGLIMAAFAGIAFAIDLVRKRVTKISWLRLVGLTLAALLSVLNAFVHSRDAYTAVVPEGIVLSAVVAAILVVMGAGGWALGSRLPYQVPPSAETRP